MLTTQLRFIFFTSITVVSLTIIHSFELPFLQSCTLEDEQCHVEQVDKFFKLYGNGIPELNISALDPLYLSDIQIKGNNNNNENFNLQLSMENVLLHKFPIIKCLSIKGFSEDLSKPMRNVLKFFSPELIIRAHCRVKGKLLLFSINGETDINVSIGNLTTIMKAFTKTYTKDGKIYHRVEQLKPRLNIGSFKTTFANSTLFNGEQIFMDTFAETINDNWEVLRDEMEPHINKAVTDVALDLINKILATIPIDKFFKKSA